MVDVAIETLVDVEEISRVLDQLNEEEVTLTGRSDLQLPAATHMPRACLTFIALFAAAY